MLKFSFAIKSGKAIAVISSNSENDIKKLKSSVFLRRYIPNAEILDYSDKLDCEVDIKKGRNKIELAFPKAAYCSNKFSEKDIISLAEYLLERARQERGLLCIHGSACEINDQAIIFWGGASGMGKTSLCRKMQEKYGAKWFADEKIIINLSTGKIEGGVGTAYLKNTNGKFIELDKKINYPIPVALFAYPQLSDDSYSDSIIDKWPAEKFKWHLFEESNRKIRATSRLLFNGTEPVMPIDTADLAKKRVKAINRIVYRKKCYFMGGNSDDICRKIRLLL